MALYQKYRPKTFSEIIGEDHIRDTLKEAVKNNKLTHAYLLCGPRGTGKTSTARLLAKALNCKEVFESYKSGKKGSGDPCNKCQACLEINNGRALDIIEIDAASHTKVDEIREVIERANFAPTSLNRKVYIIDEVHMLSNSSFNALLKTLEEPPNHVVFVLATTEAHKLPATIISRTQRFDFKRVKKQDLISNLKNIAEKEGIKIDSESLDLIAVSAQGSHRDAIGFLEKIASNAKKIDKALTQSILGIAEMNEILQFVGAIFNYNPEEGLKIAHRLYENGIEMRQFNQNVLELLRKILLFKMSERFLFEDTEENLTVIEKLSTQKTKVEIVKIIEIFMTTANNLKDVMYPILPIEIAVVEATEQKQVASSKEQGKSKDQKTSEKVEIKKENHVEIKNINTETKLETPEKESQNPDTVPAPVFQMTGDIWEKVIKLVKKENTTLSALLRDAKPIEVTEKEVVIGVKFPFHKDRISEPKNLKILEKVYYEVTGNNCIIKCRIADLIQKTKNEKVSDEELQKAAEEIFA